MQEVPEDLLREDENGELRVIKNPARRTAARDLGIAETVSDIPCLARECILFPDTFRKQFGDDGVADFVSCPSMCRRCGGASYGSSSLLSTARKT